MNYLRLYNNIITNSLHQGNTKKNNSGFELHHILPKCVGGTNSRDNLVNLTPKAHYICHWLLYKIYKNTEHSYKLACAWFKMTHSTGSSVRYNSRSYQYAKLVFSELKRTHGRNRKHSDETKTKISEANLRRPPMSEETRKKISESKTGVKVHTPESREKISSLKRGVPVPEEIRLARVGRKDSDDVKLRKSQAALAREQRKREISNIT